MLGQCLAQIKFSINVGNYLHLYASRECFTFENLFSPKRKKRPENIIRLGDI